MFQGAFTKGGGKKRESERRAFKAHLTIKSLFTCHDRHALVRAIRLQLTRIDVVAQISLQNFIPQIAPQPGIVNRANDFDTAIEVTRHPVSAADIDFFVAIVGEIKDATVLEKAPNDAAHSNVLRKSGHARTQHADAADN